jgi:hypothetical protein
MPDRKTIVGRVSVAALLGVSVFHFAASVHRAGATGVVDFPIFLDRAREFRESGVLYPDAWDRSAWEPAAAVYKFPPTFAVLLLPFAVEGGEARAIAVHRAVQVVLYALSVTLLLAVLAPRPRRTFVVLGLILALNFEPFFETLWRLQLETPLLALLAIGLAGLSRGHARPLGAALAAATMLKIYPVFLATFLAVRARWHALLTFGFAAALIGVSSWIVIGSAETRAYWLGVFPALLRELPTASSENLAPARYLVTLGGLGPDVAKRVAQVAAAIVLLVSLHVVRRRLGSAPPSPRDLAAFAWLLPAMLLALPNAWVNYQLLLLPSLLVLLAHALGPGRDARWVGLALVVASVPLLFYQPCAPPDVPWPCAQTPPFLGIVELPRALHDALVAARGLSTLVLWVALVPIVWPSGRPAPREAS